MHYYPLLHQLFLQLNENNSYYNDDGGFGHLCKCFIYINNFYCPYKTFKLGNGEHGSFKATVVNKGKDAIGIYTTLLGKQREPFAILESGEKKTYAIESNTMVSFENNNPTQAILFIELRGERNLSMTYQ